MNLLNRSKSSSMARWQALCMAACALGVVVAATAQEPAKKTEPAPAKAAAPAATETTYDNWITLSAGYAAVSDDGAAFSRRQQVPADEVFGGIESLHYEESTGKDGQFELNGRGIADNGDYALDLKLADPNKGYIRLGVEESRTWDDPSGGYIPLTGAWRESADEEQYLDRGNAEIEAGLTVPDLPQLTLKYQHQFRDGQKSSTIWGDSTDSKYVRGIVPTFLDLDETRDVVSVDATDTFGNTELGLGARYEMDDLDNSRNVTRSTGTSNKRNVTLADAVDTELFDAHAATDTLLSKKYRLTTGYLFSTLNSDIGGSRIFGADFDADYDPMFSKRQYRDEGYYDLQGGSAVKQYVMNANLLATPWDNVALIPALRIEKLDADGDARFIETNVDSNKVTHADDLEAFNERGLVDVTEELEARYTGIKDWVLSASGEWTEGSGDYSETEVEHETQEVDMDRDTDDTRLVQKYTAGATWYALKRLSLASQYYHKIADNEYEHVTDPTTGSSDQYPGYITDYTIDTDDVNVRATWRPFSALTSVTRYDLQLSDVRQDGTSVDESESAETTAQIISESITWTPLASVYLQANVNYVRSSTYTPANDVTGTNAANRVTPSRNDYWNFSQVAGLALDQKTDLQLQYSYYQADDYTDDSAVSTPYGADIEEHAVTAALKREISARLQATLKYGFYTSHDRTSGGNNDYDAHLVTTGLQYRF